MPNPLDADRIHPSATERFTYFAVCQLGWFACVESAARGSPWMGMVYAIAAVAAHLSHTRRAGLEARLLVAAVLIGAIWESVLVASGLLSYPNGILVPGTAPYWILGLWALFAIQLNVLFVWLKGRWVLAAFLGALAGPLSFRAGAALGAVKIHDLLPSYAALACGWGVLMPGLLLIDRHLERRQD